MLSLGAWLKTLGKSSGWPAPAAWSAHRCSKLCFRRPSSAASIAITRRPLGRDSLRLANRIVPFAQLEPQLKGQSCDIALCCLGTSYKDAGSEAAFREAVQVNVLAYARAARAAGARRFVMLSCQSANSASRRTRSACSGRNPGCADRAEFRIPGCAAAGPAAGIAARRWAVTAAVDDGRPGAAAAAGRCPGIPPRRSGVPGRRSHARRRTVGPAGRLPIRFFRHPGTFQNARQNVMQLTSTASAT